MIALLRRIAPSAFVLVATAGLVVGCTFPEEDYGFADDNPKKDATVDTKTDTAPGLDVVTEDLSQPSDVEVEEAAADEPSPEAGDDVFREADAPLEATVEASEADTSPDVGPDVTPDVPPDNPVEVGKDAVGDEAAEAAPDGPKDVVVEEPADVLGDEAADVVEEAPLQPLLNVWHIPTNGEPVTTFMRFPRFPEAGGDVHIYFGIEPIGQTVGANLYWYWSGETVPHVVPFVWDANNGANEYWKAIFKMPARPVGTFRYFIEVTPKFPANNATTWLYGTDTTTNKTFSQSIAAAAPYKPEVRLPVGAGDGGVPEIVITEIMVNAKGGTPETKGEWFELYSTATVPVTLHGCKLADNSDNHTINAPELILWPKVYAVLGGTMDSVNMDGFLPDYAYGTGSIQFANSGGDSLKVMLPDNSTIDSVIWGTGWPQVVYNTDSHSMQFKVLPPNTVDNDSSNNWCESLKIYAGGASYGTPQAQTDLCAP